MVDSQLSGTTRLSEDPETPGFDLQAGQTWIYPTNYAIRDYQYNIIQKALFKNTLVSLPTGLGKTFIAAVLMYNYYRWYPQGKIVFLAPTRPLVKQQIEACYNIMAIPKEVTAELTGTKLQTCRAEIWKDKRVFFATPQVLQNDLQTIPNLGSKIRCLVFDEAHKAKGNHAYCEVVRKLCDQNQLFRVLALSATPGNTIKDVLEVIKNLLISHLEFRTEESLDVRPYVFTRSLETVVVPLGDKLQKIKNDYIQTLEKYTRTLVTYKVIQGNVSNLTKGKIFMVMKEYQEKNKGSAHYNEIMKSLNICITLYHAYELLIRHGLRAFLKFFEEHISKPLLKGNESIIRIMEEIREFLGPEPKIETLPNGTFVDIQENTKFGHSKFHKLHEILLGHFTNTENSKTSKVIVFFEYRESVKEAFALLLQARPMIRARLFLGQGAGNTQKEQINVVRAFRQGECNTLLSTCIGEEGLDVGEVDLIVCFDVSNKSPIRMIQRMGRTGRKRQGQIIILVTEGKEQEILKQCLLEKNHMGVSVLSSQQLTMGFYKNCPKLVPENIKPKCHKMFITVRQIPSKINIKDIFKKMSSNSLNSPILADELDGIELKERLPKFQQFWNKSNPLEIEAKLDHFNRQILEKQRSFQETDRVKHSKTTELFVNLLQFADSKRFNVAITQNRNLKQSDIRNMFAKNEQEFRLPETQIISDKNNEKFPSDLFMEISNFLSIQLSVGNCNVCSYFFKSAINYDIQCDSVDLSKWIQPDLAALDRITEKDLLDFSRSLNPEVEIWSDDNFDKQLEEIDDEVFDNPENRRFEGKNESLFEMPGNFSELMKSFKETSTPVKDTNISKYFQSEIVPEKPGMSNLDKTTEIFNEFTKFFNDSPVKDTSNKMIESKNTFEVSENLFNSINSLPENISINKKNIGRCETSPDLFTDDESPILCYSQVKLPQIIEEEPSSPILSSYDRTSQIRKRTKIKLFDDLSKKTNLGNLNNLDELNISDICDLSNFPGLLDTEKINKCREPIDKVEKNLDNRSFLNISDLCDLSNLAKGVEESKNKELTSKKKSLNDQILEISDICDLSKFMGQLNNENSRNFGNEVRVSGERSEIQDFKIDDFCHLSQRNTQKAKENYEKSFRNTRNDTNITFSDSADFPKKAKITKKDILDISDICELPVFVETLKNKEITTDNIAELSDFCNLASFGLGDFKNKNKPKLPEAKKNIEIDDVCDLSIFDLNNKTKPKLSMNSRKSLETSIIDLVESSVELKSPSQYSVTQMLALIDNKPQKENFDKPGKLINYKNRNILSTQNRQINDLPQKKHLKSPKRVTISPKTLRKKLKKSNSDDDFEESPIKLKYLKSSKPLKSQQKQVKQKLSKAKMKNQFIDDEAIVSQEDSSQDEESDEADDIFESSFVLDETEEICTQMQVQYLKSVKSPAGGKYKIPERPKHNYSNIFSQPIDESENAYENDSFCVETEDVSELAELSQLEILEMKLKSKRKKRSNENFGMKRRRIIEISDDSD